MKYIFSLSLILFLSACAGPNPNPGERTTDVAWNSGRFDQAFSLAKEQAAKGYPWAQLRLGIFYTNGWGTDKDLEAAEYWYKKALKQKGTGNWAEGLIVGATGEPGYFNQNSDAIIAEYNIALNYYTQNKKMNEAQTHINNVINESKGKSVFFCCEFSGGRYFTQDQFNDLKGKVESKLK